MLHVLVVLEPDSDRTHQPWLLEEIVHIVHRAFNNDLLPADQETSPGTARLHESSFMDLPCLGTRPRLTLSYAKF